METTSLTARGGLTGGVGGGSASNPLATFSLNLSIWLSAANSCHAAGGTTAGVSAARFTPDSSVAQDEQSWLPHGTFSRFSSPPVPSSFPCAQLQAAGNRPGHVAAMTQLLVAGTHSSARSRESRARNMRTVLRLPSFHGFCKRPHFRMVAGRFQRPAPGKRITALLSPHPRWLLDARRLA